jgi:hypothetical protein
MVSTWLSIIKKETSKSLLASVEITDKNSGIIFKSKCYSKTNSPVKGQVKQYSFPAQSDRFLFSISQNPITWKYISESVAQVKAKAV